MISYNLSSELNSGKGAGWQVNLSSYVKLTSLSSWTYHRKLDLSPAKKICGCQPAKKIMRIASASEKVFARFFGPFLACSSLSKSSVFGWTRCEIWPWHNPPPHLFHGTNSHDTGSTQKMGINKERESRRFSHQRRRTSQWSCWLWVVYMFLESKIFLPDENLQSFNLD
jgi:hypothetical protein